jgi:hypothetical protein
LYVGNNEKKMKKMKIFKKCSLLKPFVFPKRILKITRWNLDSPQEKVFFYSPCHLHGRVFCRTL